MNPSMLENMFRGAKHVSFQTLTSIATTTTTLLPCCVFVFGSSLIQPLAHSTPRPARSLFGFRKNTAGLNNESEGRRGWLSKRSPGLHWPTGRRQLTADVLGGDKGSHVPHQTPVTDSFCRAKSPFPPPPFFHSSCLQDFVSFIVPLLATLKSHSRLDVH